jgi:hypothetical protein
VGGGETDGSHRSNYFTAIITVCCSSSVLHGHKPSAGPRYDPTATGVPRLLWVVVFHYVASRANFRVHKTRGSSSARYRITDFAAKCPARLARRWHARIRPSGMYSIG